MLWCGYCCKNISNPVFEGGKICCHECGRVIDEDNLSQEPTFIAGKGGVTQVAGRYVRSIGTEGSGSRENTISNARDGINGIMFEMGIDGGDSIANPAVRFYTIALERNFTRGRPKSLVLAACLYIACRESKKPFLLIDFSENLRVNVYVLGAVFLQLCKQLSLEEHPIVQKPVDPSLFIHRFTDHLLRSKHSNGNDSSSKTISKTALQIVASMKRDWMQTGRKPSGLCGAALYISALSHGQRCSKAEIIRIVRVCEATLTKRLIEFENTDSGGLTLEEFNLRAEELDREERLLIKSGGSGLKQCGDELLCEHKGSNIVPFAHGLCRDCYRDFTQLSGGLDGGSEPPAFQRAEMLRIMAKEAAANADPLVLEEAEIERLSFPKQSNTKNVSECGNFVPGEYGSTEATLEEDGMHDLTFEELENLSDIDDKEVDGYLLHDEEEKELKKMVWEELNKEYLEEQAAKEEAAATAKRAYEARFANCSEEERAEIEKLAADAAARVANTRKAKRQKRADEIKKMGPAQTPAEATKQVLDRKRVSSKINYDALKGLFGEDTEKSVTETKSDNEEDGDFMKSGKGGFETEPVQEYYENAEAYDYDYGGEDIEFDDY